MIADLERDPFSLVRDGDHLVVDADNGFVSIMRKGSLT
jgi:hypothetical protein